MEDYLHLFKLTANSLASNNALVLDMDLVHYNIAGLPPLYESFVTTITYMSGIVTFDELRSKLIFFENRFRHQ